MNFIILICTVLFGLVAGYILLDEPARQNTYSPSKPAVTEPAPQAASPKKPEISIQYDSKPVTKQTVQEKPKNTPEAKPVIEAVKEEFEKERIVISEGVTNYIEEYRLKSAGNSIQANDKNATIMAEVTDVDALSPTQAPLMVTVDSGSGEMISVPVNPNLFKENEQIYVYVEGSQNSPVMIQIVNPSSSSSSSSSASDSGSDSIINTSTPPAIPPSILETN